MIKSRALRLFVALAALLLYINFSAVAVKDNSFTEAYPSIACPPTAASHTSFISLSSSETLLRKSGTSAMTLKAAGNSRITVGQEAVILDSGSITPLMWKANSGVWAGALTCIAPVTSQWFIGGSADVTSKGSLTILNSGLGRALVNVMVYTESGRATEKVVALKANSFTTLPLSSLAPGSQLLAIHLLPQSGRINGFLIDERGRGLRALGGDTVNSVVEPAKTIVIPAIPHTAPKGKKALPHSLRIFVPGEIAAEIKAEIAYADGSFAPAGIDGRNISAGKVVEIPLNLIAPTGKYSLTLTSSQPILAAVKSATLAKNKSDFTWSTAVQPLEPSSFSVTGLAPLLVFTGEEISIDLQLNSPKGKVKKVEIRGSGVATYLVGEKVRTVTILKSSSDTYGAALISSGSGYGFAPLIRGGLLTRTSVPRSDIRVLIP